MSAIFLFLAVVAVIAGWWLAQQRLMAKPWLEEGALGEFPGSGAPSVPAAAIGLGVFLAVVGSLFALLISAYSTRMSFSDVPPLPAPRLLWLNTGVLVLSSAALQWAAISAKQGELDRVRIGLFLGALLALAFLAGQFLAWRRLAAAGYFLTGNPASAFFYLITGVHGLHLAGGIAALGRSAARVWSDRIQGGELRLGLGLCAAYWHFLLALWLVLFAVLTSGGDDFLAICRSLAE
ncbi:cytochrome-c oxidase [Aliidongia dinghuensis]|uniref:Cytochrome-c oxidase n=1 Tax=Aliidongia dinghuensis TaxID=1867774 RepID=A0A8J3E3X3_9PROT|nr:cytochrome c oxidase subunit 3 [Aliidongia dinghuensis]GGF22367.1 cytochrome-c oxidase [Aliidongia dinghuensis]